MEIQQIPKKASLEKKVTQNLNGSWCKSDKSTAEAFAVHLQNIFQPYDFNTDEEKSETTDFLDSPCQMDLPIRHITPNEVRDKINNLKMGESPGYGRIDINVVQNLTQKSIIFLCLIYNSILRLNHFPSQWKCAEVIMIPKPNKQSIVWRLIDR